MAKDIISARSLNLTRVTAGTTGIALILAVIDAILGEGFVVPEFTKTQWAAILISGLAVVAFVVAVDMAVRAYATGKSVCCEGIVRLAVPIKGRWSKEGPDADVTVVAIAPGTASGAVFLIAHGSTVEWVDATELTLS